LTEIWKTVDEYSGHLMVSNLGRIKRLESNTLKWNTSKLGKRFLHNTKVAEIIYKPIMSRAGYYKVRVSIGGKSVGLSVHREVAIAFIPNPNNLPCVNHKDGDKLNNRVENLEWSSYAENSLHYQETKTHDTFGKIAVRFTGSVDAYDNQTGEFICRMFGNKDMKEKGFDYRLVSAVLKGKRNHHRGCYFIKNETNLIKESSLGQFSKSSFKPLNVSDKDGNLLFTLEQYEDMILHKLTPQRVSDCLLGKARQHKSFIFKLQEIKL